MGSAASKQSGRNLAKQVSDSAVSQNLKRTKIDPMAELRKTQQQNHQQHQQHQQQLRNQYKSANGNATTSNNGDPRAQGILIKSPKSKNFQNSPRLDQPPSKFSQNIKEPNAKNKGLKNHDLNEQDSAKPDYITKDGMDPDFNAKAMSLGAVNIHETQIKVDQNNNAVRTLNKRQELEKIGKEMKGQVENKTLLDPRTIAALLDDMQAGLTKTEAVRNYGIHPDLIGQLGSGIIKVAKTRVDKTKTLKDVEAEQQLEQVQTARWQRRQVDVEPDQLQNKIDKLLS